MENKSTLVVRFKNRQQKFLGHIIEKEDLVNMKVTGYIEGKTADVGLSHLPHELMWLDSVTMRERNGKKKNIIKIYKRNCGEL